MRPSLIAMAAAAALATPAFADEADSADSADSGRTIIVIGRRLRIPVSVLAGMIAGIHTQPAALMFACERTKNETPNVGYTAVFPLATIVKIVFAQVLVMLLHGR